MVSPYVFAAEAAGGNGFAMMWESLGEEGLGEGVEGCAVCFFEGTSDSDCVWDDLDAFHTFKHGAHNFSG